MENVKRRPAEKEGAAENSDKNRQSARRVHFVTLLGILEMLHVSCHFFHTEPKTSVAENHDESGHNAAGDEKHPEPLQFKIRIIKDETRF